MVRKTRKRAVKVLTSIGTQTEDSIVKIAHVPQIKDVSVKIKRLREDELKKLLNPQHEDVIEAVRKSKRNYNRESSAMLHPHMNIRQSLSRLPSNYSHFARPINNREAVNSTVVNITQDNEEESCSSHNQEEMMMNAAKFIKPGPKSYKLKMFRKLQSLRAPVALSTPRDSAVNCNVLTAVAEATEAYATTPVMQESINVDVHEVPVQTIGAQTEDDDPHSENNQMENGGVLVDFSPTAIDERLNCNISATSLKSTQKSSDCKSDQAELSEEDANQPKYIRISAQTVHIHNHFYKM